MSIYQYKGSVHHGNRTRNRFLTPVFMLGEKYYVQELKNDSISGFIEVGRPDSNLLTVPTRPFSCLVNGPAMYCFNVNSEKVIEGERTEIESELIRLLQPDKQINTHARLLISNFLKLYKTQIELIEQANNELMKYGDENRISLDTPYQNSSDKFENEMVYQILERVERYKQLNDSINAADVFSIKANVLYYNKCILPLEALLNSTNVNSKAFDSVICEVLNNASDKDFEVTLQIKNIEIFRYLIQSSSLQSKNEKLNRTADSVMSERKIQENTEVSQNSAGLIKAMISIDNAVIKIIENSSNHYASK